MIGIKSKRPFYRNTEIRLFAYNGIKSALKNDLILLKTHIGDKDEICRRIEKNSTEISRLDDAVKSVSNDFYKDIIRLKYQRHKSDEAIAEILNCDPTTIRRNKKRLVERIAVCLYGTDALCEQLTLQ